MASIFVCRDIKYHVRSCNGHGLVIVNIGQPFTLAVSNSAPIAQFSKHSEDTPYHNRQNRADIAEVGPIPNQFWFIMAHLHREVAIMSPDFVVIGPNSAKCSPLCP